MKALALALAVISSPAVSQQVYFYEDLAKPAPVMQECTWQLIPDTTGMLVPVVCGHESDCNAMPKIAMDIWLSWAMSRKTR